jgi:hypothetical protein
VPVQRRPGAVDHRLLIASQRLLRPDHRRSHCLKARLALRAERGYTPRLDVGTPRAHRSESTGEVETHFDCAQGQTRGTLAAARDRCRDHGLRG